MDKNGKLFGKISIVDLIVLLLVVAVAVGTIYRFMSPAAAVDQGDSAVNFTIRIDDVRDFTLINYHVGLRVYDRQTGQFIGHISSIESRSSYQPVPTFDGTIINAYRPGRITIYIEITAEGGRVAPGAIYVQGTYEITAGSIIYITTKYVQVSGVIDSVNVR